MSNPDSYNTRLGKFKINAERIRNNEPELFDLMKDVVVVKAEYKFGDNFIYYTALSPKFEEVERGARPNWYHPTVMEGEAIWVKE